jgi:outer membrane protein assembly factor BamA
LFLWLLMTAGLYSQTPAGVNNFNDEKKVFVDSIKISGNDITEDFIILRELTFKPGDSVSVDQLNYNRERIFSLKLFTKVDVTNEIQNGKSIVLINVDESWYIYPIPFIRRSDKSYDTYSYGINFTYKNFRGRNENISGTVSMGYDPFFALFYDNPAFVYSDNLGFTFGSSYLNAQNKSKTAKYLYGGDFKSKFYSSFVTFYKRLDQFNLVSLSTSFDYVKVPSGKSFLGISASEKDIDRTLSLGAGYVYDSRDLKQFPKSGIYLGSLLTHKGFGIDNINYNIFRFEYMQFETLTGELFSRWRLAYRGAFGRVVPFYDYSYLGYDENIRGHSLEKSEGNNLVISSFELSYPIINDFNFSIKLPLIPRSLTSARIGIFMTAFTDAGQAFNNAYNIKLKNFYAGYGVGITILILPYNAFRFEYALGDNGKGEFLFGTGFAF